MIMVDMNTDAIEYIRNLGCTDVIIRVITTKT